MTLPNALHKLFRLVTALCGGALVMLAWSEFVFFNEGPAEKLIEALGQGPIQTMGFTAEMGVFYLVPSAFLVGLVGLFGSQGSARILLIGALTGYSIEGAVVPAVYEAVPFSYLWTSVAWHGPITVALGVFVLPRLLADLTLTKSILLCGFLGVFWGIWTTWIWVDDDFVPISALVFGQYSFATTAVMGLGYGLLWWSHWPEQAAPRWVNVMLICPSALFFALQGSIAPLSAVGLLAILCILLFALYKLGNAGADHSYAKPSNLLLLAILPAFASLVYYGLLDLGPPLLSEDLLFLAFTAGMLCWLIGVVRGLRFR